MNEIFKPYYAHNGVTIYNGDCEKLLPNMLGQAGLVLTDPPYGINESGGKNKTRGRCAEAKDYGNLYWDKQPISDELLKLVISKGKNAIIFGGNYYNLPPSKCWLVWDKDNQGSDFADCELAWTNFDKAVRKITYRWNGMLQEHMGKEKEERWHPTQKPVNVMKWCILQANIGKDSLGSKLILDPFMGVGTTLVAAKNLGLCAIGIEKEENYCEIAAKRLSQEVFNFGGNNGSNDMEIRQNRLFR